MNREIILVITLLSVSLSCRTPVRWTVHRLAQDNPKVLYYVDTDTQAVALTIDDGPDPGTTPKILDVLKQNDAHATFFLITSRLPGNETLVQPMVNEQHELGNHLLRDEPSIKLSAEDFERQLIESHAMLAEFAPTHWFRPGSGRYDARMLATLKQYGYRCALGSVYPFDP